MSLSIIERKGQEAVLAITIDVAGKEKEADGFAGRRGKAVRRRGRARSRRTKVGDTTLQVFDSADEAPGKPQTDGLLHQGQCAGAASMIAPKRKRFSSDLPAARRTI